VDRLKKEVFLALVSSMIEDAISSVQTIEGPRGPRGFKGESGKDFSLEDNLETISALVNKTIQDNREELKLHFNDLSEEDKESLRGPKGEDGQSVSIEDLEESIKLNIERNREKLRLKFRDLTEDERESLRGLPGQDGRDGVDGKSVDFDECISTLTTHISDYIESNLEKFKLKFSDLSSEELDLLRGPKGARGQRGQRGEDGKDFDWKEYGPEILTRISELVEENKLTFSKLTSEERETLKLKFDDLTFDERKLLKGARGQRGRQGIQGERGIQGEKGETGERGEIGPRGIPGVKGLDGRNGRDGQDGKDGEDAAEVEKISIQSTDKDMYFVFQFSDGTVLRTNKVDLPSIIHTYYAIGGSGGGNGGGAGKDGKSAYEIAVENGFEGTEEEWLESLVGPQGEPGQEGKSAYEVAVENGFEGTEEEWLESLIGPQGEPGQDGNGTSYYGQAGTTSPEEVIIDEKGVYQSTGILGVLDEEKSYKMILGEEDTLGLKNDTGQTQLFLVYASADVQVGNNKILGLKLSVNGNLIDQSECQAPTGVASSFAKLVTNWIVELNQGDEVAINLANFTNSDPLTVLRSKIVATTISKQGQEGQSAYEIAVENGFEGTEEQWLESLVGPQGPEGPPGTGGGALEVLNDLEEVVFEPTKIDFTDGLEAYNPTFMSDWESLDDVEPSIGLYSPDGRVAVRLLDPSVLYGISVESGAVVGDVVRISNNTAIRALADSAANSRAVGVIEKIKDVKADIRVGAITLGIYSGLDIDEDYYLSDTNPGKLVTTPPTIAVRVGRPVSDTRLIIKL
jgi:hypothetical protein